MKTKIVVLTSFLATSSALALVTLASNAWAEETGPEARQSARETRRDDRQEARGDRGDDHELLRLAALAALRDGGFGDRQSVREDRREGRQDRRDDRQEARGDGGGDRELLRLGSEADTSEGQSQSELVG